MTFDLRTPELVRHQQHGQVLVDAAQPTAVDLDKLQRRGLEELLKHHPVLALVRGNRDVTGNHGFIGHTILDDG